MDSVLDNAIATVTGNVAKAKIKIKDDRKKREAAPDKSAMGKQKASGAGGGLGALADKAGGVAGAVMDKAADVIEKALDMDAYDKSIDVQFNPTSLTLRSVGGDDDIQTTNYTRDGYGVSRGPVGLHVEMSVKLIFDQVSNTGAFVQDMLTFSASNLTSMAVSGAASLFGGSQASVQMIVEAFVATMRNERTRRVCFEWGEFYYEGMLSRVNTTYTMFDISGNPVRAEVQMVLYLVDDDVNKDFDEYWKDAYYAAYIDGNPTAVAMMAAAAATKGL